MALCEAQEFPRVTRSHRACMMRLEALRNRSMSEFKLSAMQHERMRTTVRWLVSQWSNQADLTRPQEKDFALLYGKINLPRPPVIWCQSPVQLAVMPFALTTILLIPKKSRAALIDRMKPSIYRDAFRQLNKQLTDETEAVLQKHASDPNAPLGPLIHNELLKYVVEISTIADMRLVQQFPINSKALAHSLFVDGTQTLLERYQRLIRLYIEPHVPNCRFQNFRSFSLWNQLLRTEDVKPMSFEPDLFRHFIDALEEIDFLLKLDPDTEFDIDLVARVSFSTFKNEIVWGLLSHDPLLLHHGINHALDGWNENTPEGQKLKSFTSIRSGALAYMFFGKCVLACEPPQRVSLDSAQRIHRDTGAAIIFADGTRINAWHGLAIPEDLANDPSRLTLQRIEKERNVEVRRVMIERYGFDRFLKDSNACKMSKDSCGTLYLAFVSGLPIAFVKVRNSTPEPDGSIKNYFLEVPPQVRTAREAVAWTFGMSADEYDPVLET